MREITGILCASDTELAPFLERLHPLQTEKRAMLTFHIGHIGGRESVLVYSGVCKVNAAIAAQLLIDRFRVGAVVNAGVAGGMDPGVRLFDTVVAERTVYHDVAGEILTEYHPWLERAGFEADPALLAAARAYAVTAGVPVRFGTVATGERFVEGRHREAINRSHAPLAADMETAGVAHVCHVNDIPFLGVRCITDTAVHDGREHFERNCEEASARAAEVVTGILEFRYRP